MRVELLGEEHRLLLHAGAAAGGAPAVDVRVYLGATAGEYVVEFVRLGMEAFEFRRLFERVAASMGAAARRVAGSWCARGRRAGLAPAR